MSQSEPIPTDRTASGPPPVGDDEARRQYCQLFHLLDQLFAGFDAGVVADAVINVISKREVVDGHLDFMQFSLLLGMVQRDEDLDDVEIPAVPRESIH
jgi:hypothetical protein